MENARSKVEAVEEQVCVRKHRMQRKHALTVLLVVHPKFVVQLENVQKLRVNAQRDKNTSKNNQIYVELHFLLEF